MLKVVFTILFTTGLYNNPRLDPVSSSTILLDLKRGGLGFPLGNLVQYICILDFLLLSHCHRDVFKCNLRSDPFAQHPHAFFSREIFYTISRFPIHCEIPSNLMSLLSVTQQWPHGEFILCDFIVTRLSGTISTNSWKYCIFVAITTVKPFFIDW
jgi:hypothetical protein